MSLAVQKIDKYNDNGVEMRELEKSLEKISNQLYLMDHKIMLKTEQEISNRYRNQRDKITKVKEKFELFK